MSNDVLLNLDQNNQTAVVTLNRPDKRNAISLKLIEQLDQIIDQLHRDEQTKLVIITGSSPAFCAGGDLNDFHGDIGQEEAHHLLKKMQQVLWKITTLPIPTIAWMNGLARGGGMELASACDFRFVNEMSNYGFTQGQLAISTGWGGGTLLYERIHPQEAYYWLVTADVRSAEQLKEIGFAQGIFSSEQLELNHPLIEPYTNRSYEQLKHWKDQWLKAQDLQRLKKRMDEEVEACSHMWVGQEHKDAVANFFKRNEK
ncbi:enoyl-CoA hydratase/carnithine racemase [Alkalibacillus filiformis]|uniref:Ethylmalonyl-CoA decarboxylase n=1 Tax=Alkalibacillus filiformis TaxID=200990 RepID=A0ABU0DQ71_9BACI|nr:enoyl-CoA hydratase/isomerase family protein [Alkalibacillus filiformis]MDQ0350510.1 enoyl-CoA hydratase/carnithine racemase [Alkalibacillus filiformis]